MMFAVPEGCEDNVVLLEDLDGLEDFGENERINFSIISGEFPVVYVEFIGKAHDIVYDWRCYNGNVSYDFGYQYICKKPVEYISKHITNGILMTTVTLANSNLIHAFFVSPNAYVVDTDWPYGEFKDKHLQDIGEIYMFNSDYRYLFDNVSKYYKSLSHEVNDVSRKLLRSE